MKIKKLILYTFSSLFVLIVLLFTLSYFFLDDIIDARLKKLISKKFGTFYSLEYDSIDKDIRFSEATFVVKNASFSSDTTNTEGMSKFPVVFFNSKELRIEKISTWNIITGASLDLENIHLSEPNLTVYTLKKDLNSSNDIKNKRGKPILNAVTINHFLLENGSVEFIDYLTKAKTFESNSILVDVNKISLDLTKMNDYKTLLSFDDVSIESSNPSFSPINGVYTYKMGEMRVSSLENNLSFTDIDIETKETLKQASKNVLNHKELVNVQIGSINIEQVDLKKIIFESNIEIGKVDVNDSYIHIFKNNSKRLDADFEKHVFGEVIRSIKTPIKIDTVQLFNVDVDYELKNTIYKEPAKLNFYINDGYIANFNTDVTSTDTLHFFAEGKFMKQGNMWITARILVSDSINEYQQYMGSIKNMPFSVLNPTIKQFFNADIASGYIDEVSFHGIANKNYTSGSVVFKYTDLRIDFFKKNNHKKRFFLLSEIANASTHKNNPDKKGNLLAAHYKYQRKKWQGSVGLWLGGIINGMFNVAVKELPKEIIETEKEKKKKGIFHRDKEKKKKKDKKVKHPLFHLKNREKKHHDGLHLFHKKKKNGDDKPKEKKHIFHHKKKEEE